MKTAIDVQKVARYIGSRHDAAALSGKCYNSWFGAKEDNWKLKIKAYEEQELVVIEIIDNGVGMDNKT